MVSRHRRRDGSGLYGAVAVKRPSVSRGRNHVVDRLPPTPQGRVRRLSVACRPTPSFRGSAADYPAKHGIPLAGGPGWRLRRPSVPAVEQGAGLVLRQQRPASPAAPRPARWAAAVATLVRLQGEYRAWLDNLPPNLESSALADKLRSIVELDLDELQAIDPPRGYGRD